MAHVLIRHKVIDYNKWKKVYDSHLPARQKAGLKEKFLFRNEEDANEIVLLYEAKDLKKAKSFIGSDDLHNTMSNAGVIDLPDVYFLK